MTDASGSGCTVRTKSGLYRASVDGTPQFSLYGTPSAFMASGYRWAPIAPADLRLADSDRRRSGGQHQPPTRPRHLFLFTGATLTTGALGQNAMRTDPGALATFMNQFIP